MKLDLSRTIVAVSSPLAPAARAIVRLSGNATAEILKRVLRPAGSSFQRTGIETSVIEGAGVEAAGVDRDDLLANCKSSTYFNAQLDLNWDQRWLNVGVYFWPNHRSFTGEPSAELHLIGSVPIVNRVLRCLTEAGASPAERGEFALRSFLAGKLDLVQAEAILGVIESTESDQLQWALGQLGGNISEPVRKLRSELMEMLAHLEAGLDFVEEDIQFITYSELKDRLDSIIERIEQLGEQLRSRGVGNRDLEIALIGPPNAGKSSLLNAIVGTDRAIVSPIAGTTRDTVSARLALAGTSVTLLDTAGVEEIFDQSPRAIAQQLLRTRLASCDALLVCQDLSNPSNEFEQQLKDSADLAGKPVIRIGTKADLVMSSNQFSSQLPEPDCVVSISQPELLEQLLHRIEQVLVRQTSSRFTQATHHTAIRCFHSLTTARESLARARELIAFQEGEELIASELQCALLDLSSIIGEVHNDDILGEIFSRFCIGK